MPWSFGEGLRGEMSGQAILAFAKGLHTHLSVAIGDVRDSVRQAVRLFLPRISAFLVLQPTRILKGIRKG